MPRLNGYETARRLRDKPYGETMLLIALTGWGQADDRNRSLAAGFDHHMVKPVDPRCSSGCSPRRQKKGARL